MQIHSPQKLWAVHRAFKIFCFESQSQILTNINLYVAIHNYASGN